MSFFRQKAVKAVFLKRSSVYNIFSLIITVIAIIFVLTAFLYISNTDSGVNGVIGKFLGSKTVYAEISEIFTDENGYVNAIMGGYTMLVGSDNKEKSPETTHLPIAPSPTPPSVVENTASSLTEIKNQTNISVDADNLVNEQLYFEKENKKPKVLIIHTHTTESYLEEDRSLDENKNMIAVGKVLKDCLEGNGVTVIHDTTVHDYPTYSGAYNRSAATTKNMLEANPDINIVLDVHRDAIATNDNSKLSLVTKIKGENVAQLMFVVGTDAQLSHNKWRENMKLALKLQRKANEIYPTLMRPINLREQRFNQQLSQGSIILEVGTNGNSIDEAKRSAALIADVITKVVNNN